MPEDLTPQSADTGDSAGEATPEPITPAPATQPLGWLSEIPEAQRAHEAFAGYKTKSEFHKGHLDLFTTHKDTLQKLTDTEGKLTDTIQRLPADATPEVYDFSPTNGAELNKPLVDWWRQYAFSEGLPKDVAEKTFKTFNGLIDGMVQADKEDRAKAYDTAVDTQLKDWGSDAATNSKLVGEVYKQFKSDDFDQFLQLGVEVGGKTVRIGDHPAMTSWAVRVGKAMLPDTIPATSPQRQDPVTPGMHYPDMGPKT